MRINNDRHAAPYAGQAFATLVSLLLLAACGTAGPATSTTTGSALPATASEATGKLQATTGSVPHRKARSSNETKTICKVQPDSTEWIQRRGGCRNGYAHGPGEAESADGKRHYGGELADGAFHGEGHYDWGNGVVYSGRFVRGERSGRGSITYPDGRRYAGDFLDGLYHGFGTYIDADGSTYEGGFRSGHFHGHGTYAWANGDRYTGEFHNDLMQGDGHYIRANGEKYSGQFKDNEIDGVGTYVYNDGSTYVGQFHGGKKHGDGRLTTGSGVLRQRWEQGRKISEERVGSNAAVASP